MKKALLIILGICILVVTASLVFVLITLDDADNDDHSKKREAVTYFEEQTVSGDMSYTGLLEYKTTEHNDFVTVYDGGAVTLDAEIESLIESDPLSSDILSTAVYKGYIVGSSGLKAATIQIGSEGTMVVLSQGEKIGNSEWEVIEINPQYIIVEAGDVQRKLELK